MLSKHHRDSPPGEIFAVEFAFEYVDINPHMNMLILPSLHPPLWLHNYVTWANYMSNVYMIKDYGSWNLKILIS